MNTFEITANGTFMGEYQGEDEAAAIDTYAQDAGYNDFSDLLANVPGATHDALDISLIDTEALCLAVGNKIGQAVFQDSYGDGVAFVQNISYATYRELAEAHGFDLASFHA